MNYVAEISTVFTQNRHEGMSVAHCDSHVTVLSLCAIRKSKSAVSAVAEHRVVA